MKILLKCGELKFSPELESTDSFVSSSTGATLKRVSVSLQAGTEESKTLVRDIVVESRTIESLDMQGNITGTWKARQISESYSENNPTHSYVWELTQEEVLAIETIQLGDLTVTPYDYVERFGDQGEMTIDARARLDQSQLKQLRSLPHYFSVIRHGISDTPREMRFGKLLWSNDGDYVKHDILLVERSKRDDEKISLILQPEITHLETGVAKTSCLMKGLLEVLQTKGILSEDVIKEIREKAEGEMEDRLHQFTQVDDLDKWA